MEGRRRSRGSASQDGDRHPIAGGEDRREQERILRNHSVELARSHDDGSLVLGVENRPPSEGVVGGQHTAWPKVLDWPAQIRRIAFLLGVDEDEVEWAFVGQLREQAVRISNADLDPIIDTRQAEM